MKSSRKFVVALVMISALAAGAFAGDGILVSNRDGILVSNKTEACTAAAQVKTGILISDLAGILVSNLTGILVSNAVEPGGCTANKDGILVSN